MGEKKTLEQFLATESDQRRRIRRSDEEWAELLASWRDSAGAFHTPTNTSGELQTRDDDANTDLDTIVTKQQIIKNQTTPPSWGDGYDDETESWRGEPKYFDEAFQTQPMNGTFSASVTIVAAVAGYYPCAELMGFQCQGASAGRGDLYVNDSLTTLAKGPMEVSTPTYSAKEVVDLSLGGRGIVYRGTSGAALTVSGGSLANATTGHLFGQRWYEPV